MADDDKLKRLMAGAEAEESPLLRYFKDEGERILQRNREEDWAKSRAPEEGGRAGQSFGEGLAQFKSGIPSADAHRRYFKALATSIPAAIEDSVANAVDFKKSVPSFVDKVATIGKGMLTPEGRGKLNRALGEQIAERTNSPEQLADLTVDLLMLYASRKSSGLLDDVISSVKLGTETALNDYSGPQSQRGSGEKIPAAWESHKEGVARGIAERVAPIERANSLRDLKYEASQKGALDKLKYFRDTVGAALKGSR